MIKINLLPQKRAKRSGRPGRPSVAPRMRGAVDTGGGGKQLAIGFGAVFAAAALVFLVFDMPTRNSISDYKTKTNQLNTSIRDKEATLVGFDKLQLQQQEIARKIQAIERLDRSKVVPAHVLHELGNVLSNNQLTMTDRRRSEIKNTSMQFREDWDPSHVWLTSFVDERGSFQLVGGARSRDDMTQLSKRMAASMYFVDVTTSGGEPVIDRDNGVAYFKFMITGKVAY